MKIAILLILLLTTTAFAQDQRQISADWQALQVMQAHVGEDIGAMIKAQHDQINELNKQIADLKTKCGDACKAEKKDDN